MCHMCQANLTCVVGLRAAGHKDLLSVADDPGFLKPFGMDVLLGAGYVRRHTPSLRGRSRGSRVGTNAYSERDVNAPHTQHILTRGAVCTLVGRSASAWLLPKATACCISYPEVALPLPPLPELGPGRLSEFCLKSRGGADFVAVMRWWGCSITIVRWDATPPSSHRARAIGPAIKRTAGPHEEYPSTKLKQVLRVQVQSTSKYGIKSGLRSS